MEHRKYAMPKIETKILECASTEEAQEICAKEWGIRPEDVDVTVLSEDKKLFGLLGSNIKVEAKSCAPVSYIKSCLFINEILERMNLDLVPELTEDGTIELVGDKDDMGIAIGRSGETLKALESIINMVCHTDPKTKRVYLDAGGYIRRKTNALRKLASSTAKDVIRKGKPITLKPMPAWDRCVIHLKLQDSDQVYTQSIGTGGARRVVVAPVGVEIDTTPRKNHREN